MDDEQVYGEEFYRLDFSEAIENNLLSDYKVIVLTIRQEYASEKLQGGIASSDLALDDAARLVGCYKALRDQGDDKLGKKLKRAVGFVNSIKDSLAVKAGFKSVVDCLDAQEHDDFTCQTEHIDGSFNSIDRHKLLEWLEADAGSDDEHGEICRILMNAKCLTEGIDVPSLDAILFLQPRKSQVDVVQAVGRVMRKQEGKEYGYVILPVVIPAGSDPVKALNDNETYKVVWQVLNALRSHDNKFDIHINNLHLNKNKSDRIKVIGVGYDGNSEQASQPSTKEVEERWHFNINDLSEKVFAKVVEKCGDRLYEEKMAKRIADITATVSARIDALIKTNQAIERKFDDYLQGLHASINKDINVDDAKQMLTQHLVTKRAFDAIFKDHTFSASNRVSRAMEKVLASLDRYGFSNELKDCEKFYQKISNRLEEIDNSQGRQEIIRDLYGNFLKKAFPKMSERLGIAYTPIEIVDFILHSVEHLLHKEFNKGLTDKGVHIIDAFVGTGSFLVRLLEIEGLIADQDLKRKYQHEIHANDILLLPYYITSVNIENAFQARANHYLPFDNIVLTDTFVAEKEAQANNLDINNPFWENFQSRHQQNATNINVIVVNPPYSVGQKSANDANKNTGHPILEARVQSTYMSRTEAALKKGLLDSYVKAIRWASDRIGEKGGIIGFVSNASLLNERSMQGLRRCLVDEFSSIYTFNLRGNQRTRGDLWFKEGGLIFDKTGKLPIAITFLIKNPDTSNKQAKIHYHDIGDYLSREQKFAKIEDYSSVEKIPWQPITPDKHGDWLNQRDDSYAQYPVLGNKKGIGGIFQLYSLGVVTNRDSWAYNYDRESLATNMQSMINIYNQELEQLAGRELTAKNIDQHIERDPTKISWTHNVKNSLMRGRVGEFDMQKIKVSSYRPFSKKYLYYCKMFNERHYQTPRIPHTTDNRWLCVNSPGAKGFSVLMTDTLPCLHFIPDGAQCFPRFYLVDGKPQETITDIDLKQWQAHYDDRQISKERIFYYIYGLLHAEDYRAKYQHNLTKELPRIPFAKDFQAFSDIGRKLSDLHVGYESQTPAWGCKILYRGQPTRIKDIPVEALRVTKMKIAKDQHTITYNDDITVSAIPDAAWQYQVNGYAPVKWVVERYRHKIDKKTEILDDPNAYSDDPRYILRLLLSVITVGMETIRLVKELPKAITQTSQPYQDDGRASGL